jgi:uncharacterized protein YpmB
MKINSGMLHLLAVIILVGSLYLAWPSVMATIKDATKEAVKEAAKETVKEAAKEAAKEAVKEVAKEKLPFR